MAWRLYGVLHNLNVKQPIEAGGVAVVSDADPRVGVITSANAAAASLIGGFTDAFGRKKRVAVVIYDEGAPAIVQSEEMVRGFLNALSFCTVTAGVSRTLRGADQGGWAIRSSSQFEVYPMFPTQDAQGLVMRSPEVLSYDDPTKFQGQVSPLLMNHPILQPDPDRLLWARLLDAWTRYGETKLQDHRFARVFRALEVASQAGGTTLTSSAYEYGGRVALWVSAAEIVAHPGTKKGKVDLRTVVALLESFQSRWRSPLLRERRWNVTFKGKTTRVTFVSKLYCELYSARNDFLHGNPTKAIRLFPFKNKKLPGLPMVAPLICEVALLAQLFELRDRRRTAQQAQWRASDLYDQMSLEDALLKVRSG